MKTDNNRESKTFMDWMYYINHINYYTGEVVDISNTLNQQMETDKEKINFKRDQEDHINNIEVVYEVVLAEPLSTTWRSQDEIHPSPNSLYLRNPSKIINN